MSDFHSWYVIGRTVRLAIFYVIFASLSVANPAFATEVSDQVAQKVADSTDAAEPLAIAETDLPYGVPEGDTATQTTAEAAGEQALLNSDAETKALEQFLSPISDELFDLVLSIQRKSKTLSSATIGIQKGFDYYIPMGEIARIVKFPSTLDLPNRRISGYFFNENSPYTLDAINLTATIMGETVRLPENSIVIRDFGQGIGDIYLTPEALNMIWPLNIDLDFSQQSIVIKTPRKLPYELERERQLNRSELANDADEASRNLNIEHIPNGYRMLGPQTLNIAESLRWNQDQSELTNSLAINGRGDVLGTEADYTLNTQQDSDKTFDLTDVRLRLTRRDYGDGSLLPYGLKLVQIGDVSARTPDLVERNITGRGAYISNASTIRRKQSFDQTTIEGTAQPGWEVELYQGRELLNFTSVGSDGIYRFEDVALNYGANRYRLVLYGPQGQIEERFESFDVKNKLLRPGEMNYEAALIEQRARLIDVRENNGNPDGFSKFIRVNRGINTWLSGYATFTQTPLNNENSEYFSVGANFNALGGTGQVEAYKQIDGGGALDARYATKFAGFLTNLRAAIYNDFESRDAGISNKKKTFESELRASRNFPLSFGQLNLNFATNYTKREDGSNNTTISNRQSLGLEHFNISNALNTSIINKEHNQTTGQFNVNTSLDNNWSLGSTLAYDIYPDTFLDSFRGRINYTNRDKFSSAFTFKQGIEDNNDTNAGISASYDFDQFLGNVDVDWDREDGVDVVLSANTTLGPQGENDVYGLYSKYRPQNAALSAKIYHDTNMDGEFGEGDEPIKGGRLLINGRKKSAPSDADGNINFSNAGAPGVAIITYDDKSSPDPFLAPLKDSYKTILRQGTKPFINFPLIMTGTIDGSISFSDGRPAPGLIMQLIDQRGRLVAEAPSFSDGFYVFEFVKPGRYIVQVHPSHPVFVPTKTVTVASDDLFAYGVDLQILEQAAEASVTESAESGRVAHTYHDAPVAGGTKMPVSTLSDSGVQSVIRAVRVGEYPGKVRLVLDLSAPVSYEVLKEKNSANIYIELPSTLPEIDSTKWKSGKHALFSQIDIQPGENSTQIKLAPNSSLRVQESALLPATDTLPDRLYIDFTKDN